MYNRFTISLSLPPDMLSNTTRVLVFVNLQDPRLCSCKQTEVDETLAVRTRGRPTQRQRRADAGFERCARGRRFCRLSGLREIWTGRRVCLPPASRLDRTLTLPHPFIPPSRHHTSWVRIILWLSSRSRTRSSARQRCLLGFPAGSSGRGSGCEEERSS